VTWEIDLSIIQEDAEKKGIALGEKQNALANAKALKKQGKLTYAEICEVTKVPLQVVAAMPAV
jgi:hypothetical protein